MARVTPPPYPRTAGQQPQGGALRTTPAPFPVYRTSLGPVVEPALERHALEAPLRPVHVRNAIWTYLSTPFGPALDVGVAGGVVTAAVQGATYDWTKSPAWPVAWAVGAGGKVARFDVKSGAFVPDGTAPNFALRVSVGDDGTPVVVAAPNLQARVFRKLTTTWQKFDGDVDVVDVGAAGADPKRVWYVGGSPPKLFRADAPKVPLALPAGLVPSRVAVEAASGSDPDIVWLVDEDGNVWKWSPSGFKQASPYPMALDVGAAWKGRAWVVGQKPADNASVSAPDLKVAAAGERLLRWGGEEAGWRIWSPAWGEAIDVDGNDAPWVVDTAGRIYAREIQILSAYANVREKGPPPLGLWPNATKDDEFTLRALENFVRQAEIGSGAVVLLERWDALVESPNLWENLDGLKKKIATWGDDFGFRIFLNISPTFFFKAALPAKLKLPEDFGSPAVVNAFKDLMTAVTGIPDFDKHVAYLSLGNEVDLYLGDDFQAWDKYRTFYEAVVDKVRADAPRLRMGVTTRWDYARTPNSFGRQRVKDLNARSDVTIFTYYPRANPDDFADWKPSSKALYEAEFPSAHLTFSDEKGIKRPVVFQEIGYPSSPFVGSNEDAQAQFVDHVMSKWADGPARTRVPFLSWWPLHDLSFDPNYNGTGPPMGLGTALIKDVVPPSSPAFKQLGAYLTSCGLYDETGKLKEAGKRYRYWASRLGIPRSP